MPNEIVSLQQRIALAIEDEGLTELSIRCYSGRGMRGKECFGIAGSSSDLDYAMASAAKVIIQAVHEAAIDAESDEDLAAAEAIRDAAQEQMDQLFAFSEDNMGMGRIRYWSCLDPLPETD